MSRIAIDSERCRHCNTCVEACPEAVFASGEKGVAPRVVQSDLCVACGHCVALCANAAIQHSDFPLDRVRSSAKDLLPSTEALLELFRARRSARVFESKPVPREHLETIIEAARLAPTAHNCQGTHYIVIQDRAILDKVIHRTARFLGICAKLLRNPVIRSLYGLVAPNDMKSAVNMIGSLESVANAAKQGIDKVLRGAPCLLIFHANPAVAYPDKSAQLAVQNAMLICESLGLMSFYTGYVVGACEHGTRIPALLGVPKQHRVYAGLAIGYSRFAFDRWADRKPAPIQWR